MPSPIRCHPGCAKFFKRLEDPRAWPAELSTHTSRCFVWRGSVYFMTAYPPTIRYRTSKSFKSCSSSLKCGFSAVSDFLLLAWLLRALALTIARLCRLRYLHRGSHRRLSAIELCRVLWLNLTRSYPLSSRLADIASRCLIIPDPAPPRNSRARK